MLAAYLPVSSDSTRSPRQRKHYPHKPALQRSQLNGNRHAERGGNNLSRRNYFLLTLAGGVQVDGATGLLRADARSNILSRVQTERARVLLGYKTGFSKGKVWREQIRACISF